MPQVILGIDVGSYSIKVARAERSLGEFYVTDFYELPLVTHDVLTPEQATTALLTKFFEEKKWQYDTVVSSLSGYQCSSRVLEFPFNQPKKIDSALEFELETHVPFSIEDLAIDYIILEKTPNHSKVLSFYTPKAELVKFLNILTQAAAEPRYVGVECVDLAGLHLSGMLPPEGYYILLDIGHSKTNLCVMEGSELRFARTLAIGGKNITHEIARKLEIDLETAEGMKVKQGQVSPFETGDKLAAVIQEVVDELLIHIRQTLFAYYEGGGKKIEAVYLTGGTSKLAGLDQYLSTNLRLNVSPLDVLDYSYTRLSDPEAARTVVAPSLALLFRALYPSKVNALNFRSGEFAYKRDLQMISGWSRQVAVMAVLVVFMGILYFGMSLYLLGSHEKSMNRSVSDLVSQGLQGLKKPPKGAQEALSLVNSRISETKDRLQKLEGGNELSALEILRLLSGALPPKQDLKLEVDDLNVASDHVRFEGRTTSYEAVDKVKNSLEKIPQFKNVQTGNVRKGVQDEIKFSLSFDIGAAS